MFVIIQNAISMFGDLTLNAFAEPPMTRILNYYQLPFKLNARKFFRGQNRVDSFSIDLRHVYPPIIYDGFIDLQMMGELYYQNNNCGETMKNNNLHFYNQDKSQVVIGESTVTCWVNQFMSSNLGRFMTNTDSIQQTFKNGFVLDTSYINYHIKIFEEKLGKQKKLKFNYNFKNVQIEFGKYDLDVLTKFEICFSA